MKWLITGGCGFLGTSLIRRLRQEGGHSIRVLDNLTVGTRDDLAGACDFREVPTIGLTAIEPVTEGMRCELVVGDIQDADLALACTQGADVIVHFAANTGVPNSVADPRGDCMNNVIGTFNYLEAARQNKIGRFVFASSGAPAGEVEPPIHEEMAPHPVSPYGASKLAGEGYCSAYFKSFGVNTVALRFGNVYGPGSGHKTSVVAKFIRQALNGDGLEIYGDGTQTRDFIYIDDLIDAVLLAARKLGIGGETFQIATNRETSLDEMVELLMNAFDDAGIGRPKVVKLAPRLGDVKRNYSSTAKAQNILGWTLKVELDDGLLETLKSFLGTSNNPKSSVNPAMK